MLVAIGNMARTGMGRGTIHTITGSNIYPVYDSL
jgi:hypothetical protein